MNLRLVFNDATPVENDPAVKSSTVSPSLVYVLIKYSSKSTGFCVGCLGYTLKHFIEKL